MRGAWLKVGGWERYVDMDERQQAVGRPRIAIPWAVHDALKLYGVGMSEEPLPLGDLLAPSALCGIAVHMYDDTMDLYEEVLDKVNILETVDYMAVYRDEIYFKRGIHVSLQLFSLRLRVECVSCSRLISFPPFQK